MALIKNVHQVSEEMGNSPDRVKFNYQRPVTERTAADWFAIAPARAKNVINAEFQKVPKRPA